MMCLQMFCVGLKENNCGTGCILYSVLIIGTMWGATSQLAEMEMQAAHLPSFKFHSRHNQTMSYSTGWVWWRGRA